VEIRGGPVAGPGHGSSFEINVLERSPIMTRMPWSRTLLGFWALGLVAGCGSKEPELIPDPALAAKPFPKVESSADNVKVKPPSFPGVNAAGDRRGGP
jgi:hypothetical protein